MAVRLKRRAIGRQPEALVIGVHPSEAGNAHAALVVHNVRAATREERRMGAIGSMETPNRLQTSH